MIIMFLQPTLHSPTYPPLLLTSSVSTVCMLKPRYNINTIGESMEISITIDTSQYVPIVKGSKHHQHSGLSSPPISTSVEKKPPIVSPQRELLSIYLEGHINT